MLYCTYHRPKRRFHIIEDDYQCIAASDIANGSTLRILEQKTEERIADLRTHHAIPADQIPPDTWLWLDESDVSPGALAFYSCGVRGRTTFARTLAEQSFDERRPSLVELGYVKIRYIARRGFKAQPATIATELRRDYEGRTFIIVEDYQGYYLDQEGELHCSAEEGYTEIVKQFLYCFENVNAAIAKIDGSTPPALRRWEQKQAQPGQETHRNNVFHVSGDAQGNTATSAATLGGYSGSSTSQVTVSNVKNIIDGPAPSMIFQQSSKSLDFRTAPWNSETLIALASSILAVPDRGQSDDAWQRDWEAPAHWMITATQDTEPRYAWAQIERRIRGMVSGPTWYATKRTTNAPITLRHVVGFNKQNDELTGHNWRVVAAELDKAQWYPSGTISYDGPPLEYAAGYMGISTSPESGEASSSAIEVPITGMRRKAAQRLCDAIWAEHPLLNLTFAPIENSDRVQVGIEYATDQWLDLPSFDAWQYPTPETLHYVELAERFAAERTAIPSEVIEVAQEMTPILLEDTPERVTSPPPEEPYLSVEELSAELRGLRPGIPPVVAAPVVPNKAGMSLFVAKLLLDRIMSEGYAAQLCPISDDRANLTVEASPGLWIEIDKSEAWQQHLKSVATAPPGSVASVVATLESNVMQQAAAQ